MKTQSYEIRAAFPSYKPWIPPLYYKGVKLLIPKTQNSIFV